MVLLKMFMSVISTSQQYEVLLYLLAPISRLILLCNFAVFLDIYKKKYHNSKALLKLMTAAYLYGAFCCLVCSAL